VASDGSLLEKVLGITPVIAPMPTKLNKITAIAAMIYIGCDLPATAFIQIAPFFLLCQKSLVDSTLYGEDDANHVLLS
jgi:hypothetical protein